MMLRNTFTVSINNNTTVDNTVLVCTCDITNGKCKTSFTTRLK